MSLSSAGRSDDSSSAAALYRARADSSSAEDEGTTGKGFLSAGLLLAPFCASSPPCGLQGNFPHSAMQLFNCKSHGEEVLGFLKGVTLVRKIVTAAPDETVPHAARLLAGAQPSTIYKDSG